jgi:hypothetical protein
MFLVLPLPLIAAIAWGRSRSAARVAEFVPLSLLVDVQAFRLPLGHILIFRALRKRTEA